MIDSAERDRSTCTGRDADGKPPERPETASPRTGETVAAAVVVGPWLKLAALVTLTVQSSAAVLSMRYARTRPGDMFVASTAVVATELVKLFACLALVYSVESQWSAADFARRLYDAVAGRPADTFRVCVPSLVYLAQNNLHYVSMSHLDAATFQVTYQLRILATAAFSVLLLKRRLSAVQWTALVTLVAGVVLVQLQHDGQSASVAARPGQSRLIGLASSLASCCLCGFAGVYLEKILKGAGDTTLWMRNVQLSLVSVPLGMAVCAVADWREIAARGFFHGYDPFVVYLVCLQAAGGLIVATVIKYADNILKGFATSSAIVVSCAFSAYFFGTPVGWMFAAGAAVVAFSVLLYGCGAATTAADGEPKPRATGPGQSC